MVSEGDFVAIFNSIHRVMKAEKILKERGYPIMLIPAPRSLSSDCGLAIRYGAADRESVESLLAELGLAPEEIHRKSNDGYERLKGGS